MKQQSTKQFLVSNQILAASYLGGLSQHQAGIGGVTCRHRTRYVSEAGVREMVARQWFKGSMIAVLLCLTTAAKADWTPTARIEVLNIGGNGLHGTFVSLASVSLSGCGSTTAVFLAATNPNYKEFIAALLAAKIAEKEVRLLYSTCSNGYWLVSEVVVP